MNLCVANQIKQKKSSEVIFLIYGKIYVLYIVRKYSPKIKATILNSVTKVFHYSLSNGGTDGYFELENIYLSHRIIDSFPRISK